MTQSEFIACRVESKGRAAHNIRLQVREGINPISLGGAWGRKETGGLEIPVAGEYSEQFP